MMNRTAFEPESCLTTPSLPRPSNSTHVFGGRPMRLWATVPKTTETAISCSVPCCAIARAATSSATTRLELPAWVPSLPKVGRRSSSSRASSLSCWGYAAALSFEAAPLDRTQRQRGSGDEDAGRDGGLHASGSAIRSSQTSTTMAGIAATRNCVPGAMPATSSAYTGDWWRGHVRRHGWKVRVWSWCG